jgi:chromosome segregation ATPase
MRKLLQSLKVLPALLLLVLVTNLVPQSLAYAASSTSTMSASSTFTSSATASVSKTDIRSRTKELLQRRNALSTDERKALIAEFKTLNQQELCNRRQLNLAARIEYYRSNQRDYTTAIEQLHLNAQKASTRLKALDYDTTKLDDLIKDLEEYLFSVKSAYFNAIDSLEINLAKSCYQDFAQINSLGESLKNLKETRTAVKNIDDQVLKIMNAIKDTKKKEQPAKGGNNGGN